MPDPQKQIGQQEVFLLGHQPGVAEAITAFWKHVEANGVVISNRSRSTVNQALILALATLTSRKT